MDVLKQLPSQRRFDRFNDIEVSKKAPGHRCKTDDRERCIYLAQPSKVEPIFEGEGQAAIRAGRGVVR